MRGFYSPLVLGLTFVVGFSLAAQAQESPKPSPQRQGAAPEKARGQAPLISEGKVPVLEFLKWMQAVTGKPVLYPSTLSDRNFDDAAMIRVLGDIQPFTLAIARRMLETNGYRLAEETLDDGRVVIRVWHESSKSTGLDAVTPILEGHDLERLTRKAPEPTGATATWPDRMPVADLAQLLLALDEQPIVHPFAGRVTPTVHLIERPEALTAEVITAVLEAAGISVRVLTLTDGCTVRFLAEPPPLNPFGLDAAVMIVELQHLKADVAAHALRTSLSSVGKELSLEAFMLLTPNENTLVLGGSASTLSQLRKLITQLDGES